MGFGDIMANRKLNTNFRLGLDRQQLIAAAKELGKPLKSAKKANTKTLENFVIKQLADKKTKVPEISDRARKDIRDAASTYGIREGLQLLGNRIKKLTGDQNESNYLRLTAANALSSYYSGAINNQVIDELVSRMEGEYDEIISGIRNHGGGYYSEIIRDYADELIDKQVQELENKD